MAEVWKWTVRVTPPSALVGYEEFEVSADCHEEIDPLTVAMLIGKHVARVLIDQKFESAEEFQGA